MGEVVNKEQRKIRSLYETLLHTPLKKFPRTGMRFDVPADHGVYVIYNARGKILHVGRTVRGKKGLIQRLKNHLRGQSSFMAIYFDRDLSKLRQGCQFRYLVVPNARERALLEAYTTGLLCPAHIGIGELKICI